tara:strand:+ start:114 stop:407 length:294 start_codon:yes stop_codon:yes gene_type:complete
MVYKNGQTWPKGEFKSGLLLCFSDDELRNGNPSYRNIKVRNFDCMARVGHEVASDYHLEIEKYTYYPAGKPLVTDTQIRAFRKKHISGWNGEWMVLE